MIKIYCIIFSKTHLKYKKGNSINTTTTYTGRKGRWAQKE